MFERDNITRFVFITYSGMARSQRRKERVSRIFLPSPPVPCGTRDD